LFHQRPAVAKRMVAALKSLTRSLDDSFAGLDYPEGQVAEGEPEPRQWRSVEAYRPYFKEWKKRPEYESRFRNKQN